MLGSLRNSVLRLGAVFGGQRVSPSHAMAIQHTVDVPTKSATFAMGCFWAPDSIFGATPGVIRTRVGYSGGTKKDPTYHSLDDHTESIIIDFDPLAITYPKLLDIFWENHSPSQRTCTQYTSIIFYHDDEQQKQAEESMTKRQALSSTPFVTKIVAASTFYDAEDYHQKYRLQGHPELMQAIKLRKNDPLLKSSHVAARLNGYVVGRGSVEHFNSEAKSLGLDDKTIEYVRKYHEKNKNLGPHC